MTQSPAESRPTAGLDVNRVLPIFVLVLVDVLGLTLILPLLHLYAARYGASPFQIGIVAASFPLAQLIGVPVMGALSDRYGRKPLLLISQITTCAGFILLGLANSLLLIIASRVLDGLFGANLATAQAALSDVTDDDSRAQGLGLTGAAFGLGFIFGPLISIAALEFSDSLAVPAFIAAVYSFISILLTLTIFKETLPPEARARSGTATRGSLLGAIRLLNRPGIGLLLALMFAQQAIFFGFESLLGLFVLSRLGLLGQGSALIFLVVGVVLVTVQLRLIGRWSRRYGEHRLVWGALALLAISLILVALTPEQPHPLYVKQVVQNLLQDRDPSSTEAIIGSIGVALPDESDRGVLGIGWMLLAVIPLSVGAGLIRPALNSLMTKRAGAADYGGVLGASAAFVSAANAIAPLIAGLMFEAWGSGAPFLIGGVLMGGLALLSYVLVKPAVPIVAESA
jgi:MFS family permease